MARVECERDFLAKLDEPFAAEGGMPVSMGAPRVVSRWRMEVDQQRLDTSWHLGTEASVQLNVYDTAGIEGWANSAFLQKWDLGIHHVGVEVYGEEWYFGYFSYAWSDPSIDGVLLCEPRAAPGLIYRESVHMGVTALDKQGVHQVLASLRPHWRACSYHLTQRNCLTFASTLCEQFGLREKVPPRLLGMCGAVQKSQVLAPIVDGTWNWQKWWHVKKEEMKEARRQANLRSLTNKSISATSSLDTNSMLHSCRRNMCLTPKDGEIIVERMPTRPTLTTKHDAHDDPVPLVDPNPMSKRHDILI